MIICQQAPEKRRRPDCRNWLFLIEAVHSAGPMSEIRVHALKKLLKDCNAELIFVTAFLRREDFRKWSV
ncbi:MAG: hypothetical protein LBK73_16355, partial [Treponema sp.]|nr:hypothetical protein [Treponema sp.]